MLHPGAEWENNPLLPLRTKALYQISQAYEMVTGMATVRLGAINRDQPRKYRYNRRTLIDHWLTQAQAINNFAVVLGLISGAEYAAIIRRFQQTYPEVLEKLE